MSVKDQQDADGDVLTDTLALKVRCDRTRIRLRFSGGQELREPPVKFLGLCFADTSWTPPTLPPNRAAWGKSIAVPERTQLDFQEGEQSWCSPTSTSMVLAWWAGQLPRPELERDRENRLVHLRAPGDVHGHLTMRGVGRVDRLAGLHHVAGDALAHLDRERLLGLPLVLGDLAVEGDGPEGHAVGLQQVQPERVVVDERLQLLHQDLADLLDVEDLVELAGEALQDLELAHQAGLLLGDGPYALPLPGDVRGDPVLPLAIALLQAARGQVDRHRPRLHERKRSLTAKTPRTPRTPRQR